MFHFELGAWASSSVFLLVDFSGTTTTSPPQSAPEHSISLGNAKSTSHSIFLVVKRNKENIDGM